MIFENYYRKDLLCFSIIDWNYIKKWKLQKFTNDFFVNFFFLSKEEIPKNILWNITDEYIEEKYLKYVNSLHINNNLHSRTYNFTLLKDIKKLSFLACNNIDTKYFENTEILTLSNLKTKEVNDMKKLKILSIDCVNLNRISNLSNIENIVIKRSSIQEIDLHLTEIKDMYIRKCSYLTEIKAKSIDYLNINRSCMPNLEIMECIKNLYLKNIDTNMISNIKKIGKLHIFNCSNLSDISHIENINELIIEKCESLKFLTNINKVKKLKIIDCPMLEYFSGLTDIDHIEDNNAGFPDYMWRDL